MMSLKYEHVLYTHCAYYMTVVFVVVMTAYRGTGAIAYLSYYTSFIFIYHFVHTILKYITYKM